MLSENSQGARQNLTCQAGAEKATKKTKTDLVWGLLLHVCTHRRNLYTHTYALMTPTHTYTPISAQAQKGICKMTHMHACTPTQLHGDQ